MTEGTLGLETLALHAGHVVDHTGSCAVPLHMTVAYLFRDSEHAARLFELKEFGNIYTRMMNPTTDVFEKRVAAIEGGTAALATSSGQAAITLTLLGITQLGDEILAADNLYGGTYQLLNHTMAKLGRKTKFVDSTKVADFKAALTPKTRAIYIETIGNPKLDVPDFEALGALAREHKIPLIVDNTVGVGLVKPLDFGANIITSSATKYIGGHGTAMGGVIVDAGNFDWGNGKFPEFTEPDPSYHGIKYWEAFGDVPGMGNIALALKLRVTLMRDLGTTISPFNSRELLLGLETLPMRQKLHSANAMDLATWLQEQAEVAWVNYPGLAEHPSHSIATKYLKKGFGGLVGFGIKGGREAGAKFLNSVELLSHVTHLGDAKSLVTHPASTTHQQLTEAEQLAAGVSPDYIRFSVGLESLADIKADLKQALQKSQS